MNEQKNDKRSLAMLVISMLIFGTIGVFRRGIPVSSGFLACARGLIGASFLCLFVKVSGGSLRHNIGSRAFLWLVLSGAAIGFNWILLFEAFNHTSVPVATLCYYMQPTIVILLSPLLFKEKLSGRKLICAAAAVIGMVLISGVAGGTPVGANDRLGIFLGLGAAVLYSSVVIMNKKVSGVDAFEKTVIQLFSAGAVMIPYLLLTRDPGLTGIGWTTVVLILIVGLVHTGFAYALYFGGMDGVKAQTAAVLSYIDPVSALFFSALFLHESLSPQGIIGAVLILGAAVISEG